ncbi:PKD domain-containing protein [Lewinella sp. JB7]|uniref:PKD domain-containing protein n=1 Tax=Lewinella sp. JB7 TaxID=2962887 RepID=UPI0020C9F1CE|nr:PKD domain-containing protein [Lewinella sp. JB7]MCP9236976.1 PKD domain-containing protein [Lewinella sp. JB7]
MQYTAYILSGLILLLFVTSCDELELPGVGELPDLTPPAADFAATPSESAYREISFSNRSVSATDFVWDFGDGNTSTEANPTHTYAADGDYTVSLTATDKLNATDQTTQVISIVEPVIVFTPEIMNPGFDIEGEDSYRDHWRNGDLGGVIQITSSPVHDGVKAAKLPSDGSRIGYQLIKVQANKEYTVSFYYTLKTSPEGSLTVSILDNGVESAEDIGASTIASVTVNDQTSSSDYVLGSVTFASGENTEVAIFFTNVDVEARIDSFTIVEN